MLFSSPFHGEGDREAVKGFFHRLSPSVSPPAAPIHLPIEWGGETR